MRAWIIEINDLVWRLSATSLRDPPRQRLLQRSFRSHGTVSLNKQHNSIMRGGTRPNPRRGTCTDVTEPRILLCRWPGDITFRASIGTLSPTGPQVPTRSDESADRIVGSVTVVPVSDSTMRRDTSAHGMGISAFEWPSSRPRAEETSSVNASVARSGFPHASARPTAHSSFASVCASSGPPIRERAGTPSCGHCC